MANKNIFLILAMDIVLFIAAIYAAYLIRFDFVIPSGYWYLLIKLIPLAVMTKLIVFYFFGLYRGMWRYTSIADLFSIIKAASLSSLVIVSFILLSTRFIGFPRSIFIIDWCFTIFSIATFRLLIRIFFVHFGEKKSFLDTLKTVWILMKRKYPDKKKLLIIGAGDCGEKIYREIRDNLSLKYNIVGFLDDDPDKVGRKIHSVSVLTTIKNIEYASKKVDAEEILIAISSATAKQMRSIIDHCKRSNLPFKTVPGMGELINGKVTVNAIREVSYQDLLGRDVVCLKEEDIGAYLKDRVVLVTGAGGSIGSELCRQICRFKPQKLVLFERAESPLYYIEMELKNSYKNICIVPSLSDVQNKYQLEKVFTDHHPSVIFHAAAYKHVPMLELQPWRAIENNIYGTRNIIEFAKQFEVERFVFVSTDKAVRPANVMGASKRIAEMLVQNKNIRAFNDHRYMIVRFGNVVGSVGSVVPLFREQIKNGGPVTVTHPEVTRYFMTIPEACQLILQAGAMGSDNFVDTFILDMGTPIKIVDMARDLIRLSGFEPGIDIKIEFIGLREGEKLYEELITKGEDIIATDHEKIMVLRGEEISTEIINKEVEELIHIARRENIEKINNKIKEIIPEFKLDEN